MEISPIAGVRLVSPVRSRAAATGSFDIPDIDSTARAGDETYTPSVARSASGPDEEEPDTQEEDSDGEPSGRPAPNGLRRHISTFA